MGRRYVHVSADVDVSEVLDDIDTDDLLEVLRSRNVAPTAPSFDLLSEIRWHLLHAGTQAALAMIESAIEQERIPDAQRQEQFQMQGKMQ